MRPKLHFTSPSGWINDPLGLSFHGDRYHLFYQHVPDSIDWAPDCRWGHATSDDLLTWTTGPIALEPGDGDGGCWSGSIITDEHGDPTMFYTSVDTHAFEIGRPRIARPAIGSEESWLHWEKGPVVAAIPDDERAVAFRDPFVFHDGSDWRMLIGAGRTDGTALAYGYVADDLDSWRYDGVFASRHRSEREDLWTGSTWECPQLLEIDGRWILLVSVWEPVRPHYTAYAVGDVVDGRFIPESPWQRLTHGPSYYAGAVFRDRDGTPGIVYWLRGVSDAEQGWAGAHSIPHRLELDGDHLRVRLPAGVADRRGPGIALAGLAHAPAEMDTAFEVEWEAGGVLSLDEGFRNVFRLERTGTTLSATADAGHWSVSRTGSVRVLVDATIVEVIGSFGALAFPADRAAQAVLSAEDSTGTAYSLDGRLEGADAAASFQESAVATPV